MGTNMNLALPGVIKEPRDLRAKGRQVRACFAGAHLGRLALAVRLGLPGALLPTALEPRAC